MASMGRKLVGLVVCGLLVMVMVQGAVARQQYPKQSKCMEKQYKQCYNVWHTCPKACPYACDVDCDVCKPICKCDKPGAVCQDPRFIGGDGVTFYFHGRKDRDFCLLSDSNLHINAHFIGKRNPAMNRDFTWVQSIGVLFDDHRLFIGAQKTATWDASVDRLSIAFDGEPIFLPASEGTKWQSAATPSVTIARSRDTNGVVVEVDGRFKIMATVVPITDEESRVHGYGMNGEDCLAHLELGFKFYSLADDVHGVLGQTYGKDYTSRVKIASDMPIMGGEREFASSGLFTTDCSVARLIRGRVDIKAASEFAPLECGSGMNGNGIVCKK
ncbi:uncharacterized protein LOC131234571 [Magnolia sinica]|uniref:uncharacterized protein LOC131234571 n=1 Tax=Magnolia sinica TaxID=86752 RepID=UPI002657E76F|nr:uncharacterized protein LOC131234571 [Magnolia sinica]